MNRYAFAAGAAALSILVAACGSSETSTPTPAAAETSAAGGAASGGIHIKDFKYSGTLTLKTGEKVTVTNDDAAGHTLTSKTAGQFTTGKIDPSGGTGTFTAPATAGSYPFICSFHPKMAGTLAVEG